VSPPAVYSAVEATVAVATAEEVVGVKVETEAASLGGTVARTG